jgi:hypothetical protein
MNINQKRLDELEDVFGWADAEFEHPEFSAASTVETDELHELVRLARIGLWAETHAVPLLFGFDELAFPKVAIAHVLKQLPTPEPDESPRLGE